MSRILRPFVVIYDRESDRMHTLASPLEGDQATLLPHTERLIVDLCTICCPTTYFSTFTKKKEEKSFSNNADVCCLQNCAVCRKKAEKMHTMIIHFCLLFLSQCKKSSRISPGDLGQSLTIVVPDAFKL